MKRLLALLAGGLGVGAFLRRRARPAPAASHVDGLADGLRAKLAASRPPEEAAAPPDGAAGDVAARRAEVHERARRALDELES